MRGGGARAGQVPSTVDSSPGGETIRALHRKLANAFDNHWGPRRAASGYKGSLIHYRSRRLLVA